ncbi:hypothetical protein KEM48_014287 [Puccinia striiformis f. sp. tritici PST-130]|nr:hypothetical protein KEM48_014287 [Puccinia striiformis f. sp. tritici PST-130]
MCLPRCIACRIMNPSIDASGVSKSSLKAERCSLYAHQVGHLDLKAVVWLYIDDSNVAGLWRTYKPNKMKIQLFYVLITVVAFLALLDGSGAAPTPFFKKLWKDVKKNAVHFKDDIIGHD